jgi:hypothetical protein
MDGIQFGGLEGFLQGCKVKNVEQQRRIFRLSGLAAQQAGRSYARAQDHGTLFWLGVPFSRYSEAWKELYTNAYFEAAIQNKGFRDALQASKGKILKHSMASHHLNFVADISSRILLLEKGKLVKDLPNADGAAIAELNEYFGIQAE